MNKIFSILPSDITVATFATFGSSTKYRDYTAMHTEMSKRCFRGGVPLLTYSFKECSSPNIDTVSRFYPMRKGAGYWAWKPELIKKALFESSTRYLLYLDVDLRVRRLDSLMVDPSFAETGVALFETRENLSDWCSKRCLRRFKLPRQGAEKIFSASAILIDSKMGQAIDFLDIWDRSLRDYRLTLDPVFTFNTNHRHDQSVLSCLIATSQINTGKFAQGFYQTGVDNGDQTIDSAWLIHGEVRSDEYLAISSRLKAWRSLIFHKYELANYIVSKFGAFLWLIILKKSAQGRHGTHPNDIH